ncbi:MAG: hypothetical protein EAZ07_06585 [Cytophagales bacterium]|nr:MAG: hypothetical protein EAZ07_06585 [Cytophagales bacterium]
MYFKTLFFLLFLTFLSSVVRLKAQINSNNIDRNFLDQNQLYIHPSASNKILLNTTYEIEMASNALTNSFMKAALFKGFIDEKEKNDVSKHLSQRNTLGLETNFAIHALFRKPKYAVIAGIGHRELLYTKFSSGLFETIFRGNKMYTGQNVELGNTNIGYLNYDYLYIGLNKSIKNFNIYSSIQLIRGGFWLNSNIEKAKMYTEVDGSYINFDSRLTLNYSPNKFSTFPSTSGLGSAINLGINWTKNQHKINFEIRDLGFIYWKNQSKFSLDSNYKYEGIEANDLFDQNVFASNNIEIDTIAQKIKVPKNTENITQFIPSTIIANYNFQLNPKTELFLGVKQILLSSYLPKITLRAQFQILKSLYVLPSINYGGFGKQSLEIGLIKSFNKTLIASCNLYIIEYLLFNKNTLGSGLNFSLTKSF